MGQLFPLPNGVNNSTLEVLIESTPFFSVPKTTLTYHHKEYWTLIFVEKGKGTLHLEQSDLFFGACSIIVVKPDQYSQLEISVATAGISLGIKKAYFESFPMNKHLALCLTKFKSESQCPVLQLCKEDFLILWNTVLLIQKDLLEMDPWYKLVICNCVNLILLKVFKKVRATIEESKSQYYLIYSKFYNLLVSEESNVRKINEYASLLYCSTKQLRSACLHCVGLTPIELVDDIRLTKAKQKLFFENKSVKDVAYELNFTDIAHFSNFFKSKTGVSPSKYKPW